MSAAATATTERSSDPNAFLPTFPGEESLAHEGTQFMEDAKAAMSAKGLMAVAEGEMPASALRVAVQERRVEEPHSANARGIRSFVRECAKSEEKSFCPTRPRRQAMRISVTECLDQHERRMRVSMLTAAQAGLYIQIGGCVSRTGAEWD